MFNSPSISDAKIFMKKIVFGIMVAIATMGICAGRSGKGQTNQSVQASGSSVATIPSDHIFTLRLDTPLHSRITKKGDKIEFHTAEDLIVDREILITYRSTIRAEVAKSKRAGLLFGRAEIQVRLMDVRLSDGTVLSLQAVITRVGFDPVDSKDGEISL